MSANSVTITDGPALYSTEDQDRVIANLMADPDVESVGVKVMDNGDAMVVVSDGRTVTRHRLAPSGQRVPLNGIRLEIGQVWDFDFDGEGTTRLARILDVDDEEAYFCPDDEGVGAARPLPYDAFVAEVNRHF